MHILLGFFVASVLLYWWARGSIIVAIMGSLFCGMLFWVSGDGRGFVSLLLLAACWTPAAIKMRLAEERVLRLA